MNDPGTETILAAIQAHAEAVRKDIQALDKRLEKSIGAYALEVGEYRRVAMDVFERILAQQVEIQQLKEELTMLEARVTLSHGNGKAPAAAD